MNITFSRARAPLIETWYDIVEVVIVNIRYFLVN